MRITFASLETDLEKIHDNMQVIEQIFSTFSSRLFKTGVSISVGEFMFFFMGCERYSVLRR
jgi:hypothetical protein